jgi:hypothetical protein
LAGGTWGGSLEPGSPHPTAVGRTTKMSARSQQRTMWH